MSSTEIAQNGLDRGLAELESLGLTRPPNVLFAEYLSALTAEEVLDASRAELISSAFNRARYSAVPADDPQVLEAAASLEQAATRLAAMSPELRTQISQRVRDRIRPVVEQAQKLDAGMSAGAWMPTVPLAQTQVASVIGETLGSPLDLSEHENAFVTASPRAVPRKSGLPRISLEWCALAGLALFFGGYFFREAANKIGDSPLHFRARARSDWTPPEPPLARVRDLAREEAGAKHYVKARLALELVLVYSKEDAGLLNELAWYYVLPEEGSETNPKRALELVNRALELSRAPAFLDTAAEAHFQLGHFSDAIKLEKEALTREVNHTDEQSQNVALYEQQLEKFQEGERLHAPASASKPK